MTAPSHETDGEPFQTTHWSLVVAAGEQASPRSKQALADLCAAYWQPLYAYARRCGNSVHDAQDLTQAFFARLLDKDYLLAADRQRGRFRSFLLAALKHFLANERKAARAQKRGGGRGPISWDVAAAEADYQSHPADEMTPQRLFEHRWALLLLDRVLGRLQAEFAGTERQGHFEHLRGFLTADSSARPYGDVARDLGTSEAAVKMAVHRLRRRYRELLREEIAHTVDDPEDVDDELRELFAALAAGNR